MSWIRDTPQGARITVRVQPRAARNEVAGVLGEALKIRLQAPPVEGRANEALVRFLAETLDVPRGHVLLESGATGRNKTILAQGLKASEARARLGL